MFKANSRIINSQDQPDESMQRPTKRPRVLVACLRCKVRRQKCDNQLPACSNCAKAKLSCTFADNQYPSSYVTALEDRVAWLETHLPPSQNAQILDHLNNGEAQTSGIGLREEASPTVIKMNSPSSFASSVELLSLQAASESRYFGVSSGVSLAHLIENAVYEKARPSESLNLPAENDSFFPNIALRGHLKAPLPSQETGAAFIHSYLSYIHPQFPFLSTKTLWRHHYNSHDLENSGTDKPELDYITLQLVYAIGSRCLQLVSSPLASGVNPEGHYASAVAKVHDKVNVPSVQNIRIMLLVAVYALRSPSGSSIWHLCGLMIRQCLELGLHRQLRSDGESPYSNESKNRLFWSIYHLERRIALVLGRPFAIADDEIDVHFPSDVRDDSADSAEASETRQDDHMPNNGGRGLWLDVQTRLPIHVLLLQLDQLNTKSRITLSRLAKTDGWSKAEKKIIKRFQKLENWKAAIFGSSVGNSPRESTELISFTHRTPVQTPISQPELQESERLSLLLSYHRARRLLLQAILTDVRIPNRTFEFSSFARSSGEVCQLNRRLHRLNSIPFTLLDLHSVFVAGFSMIYCAWTKPELYDAEMAADFGACSTVLYVIAEQWVSAKKYRDAFELVAAKTVEFVSTVEDSRRVGHRVVSNNQQSEHNRQDPISAGDKMPPNDDLPRNLPHQDYDMERIWGDYSANDGFDVWRLMNQFVQTQDYNVQYDAANFTGVEELLIEEGLGWFYGSSSGTR